MLTSRQKSALRPLRSAALHLRLRLRGAAMKAYAPTEEALEAVRALSDAVPLPVTVKVRLRDVVEAVNVGGESDAFGGGESGHGSTAPARSAAGLTESTGSHSL